MKGVIFISGADVASLIGAINSSDKDGMFGDSFAWIVMLLIIAGIFGGGLGFGNNAGLTAMDLDTRFNARDIFNVNTAVLTSAGETQREVLSNRYENALGVANLQKDILVGNQVMQAQMADCCCSIKSTILEDGQKTRDLINSINAQNMLEKINDLKSQVNNQAQTQNIIDTILSTQGRWVGYTGCGTCSTGCGCGSLV